MRAQTGAIMELRTESIQKRGRAKGRERITLAKGNGDSHRMAQAPWDNRTNWLELVGIHSAHNFAGGLNHKSAIFVLLL